MIQYNIIQYNICLLARITHIATCGSYIGLLSKKDSRTKHNIHAYISIYKKLYMNLTNFDKINYNHIIYNDIHVWRWRYSG